MWIWCSRVCTGFAFTALNIRWGGLPAVTKRMKWDTTPNTRHPLIRACPGGLVDRHSAELEDTGIHPVVRHGTVRRGLAGPPVSAGQPGQLLAGRRSADRVGVGDVD